MALIDLKAHYLDLLVTALEKAGYACLHRPVSAPGTERGVIYATRSATATRSEFVVHYDFDAERCAVGIEFRDQRPKVAFAAAYQDGLDDLWPKLQKAILGNRIEFKPAPKKEAA